MRRIVSYSCTDNKKNLLWKVTSLLTILGIFNLLAWCWAFSAFNHYPKLLSMTFLAYGFGLRHAMDADHIAAIDNITRKLMQEDKQPISVGLFFSLGHSSVVIIASILVAITSSTFKQQLHSFQIFGTIIGPVSSIIFLLCVAIMNISILYNIYKNFSRNQNGKSYSPQNIHILFSGNGLLVRFLKPLFGLISKSWHMYPLGFLFGLGLDTATEIGLLGLAASQSVNSISLWSILVFPILFTAGMSLVDTLDGILMLFAYNWSFTKPIRTFYYNMTLTFVSITMALAISSLETLDFIRSHLNLRNIFWNWIDTFASNFGVLGGLIVVIFMIFWLVCIIINNYKKI